MADEGYIEIGSIEMNCKPENDEKIMDIATIGQRNEEVNEHQSNIQTVTADGKNDDAETKQG